MTTPKQAAALLLRLHTAAVAAGMRLERSTPGTATSTKLYERFAKADDAFTGAVLRLFDQEPLK